MSGQKAVFVVCGAICIVLGVHLVMYPIRARPGARWPFNYLTDGIARLIGVVVLLVGLYWVHLFRTH